MRRFLGMFLVACLLMVTLELLVPVGVNATELYVMIQGSMDLLEWYRMIGKQFEEQHPGVTVVVDHTSSNAELEEKLIMRLASGIPPDVFMSTSRQLKTLFSHGYIVDLMPYVGEDPDFEPWDLLAIESWQHEGCLLGIPYNVDIGHIGYNVNMFNELGLATPNSLMQAGEWTWDVFLETAKKGTQDLSGIGGSRTFGYAPHVGSGASWIWDLGVYSFLYSAGGQILSEDGTRCVLDEPIAGEALQWWADLRQVHGVIGPIAANALITGNYLMETLPTFRLKQVHERGIRVGIASHPAYVEGMDPVHLTLSNGNVVIKGGKEQLAYEFCKLAASYENGIRLAEMDMRLPSNSRALIDVSGNIVQQFADDADMLPIIFQLSSSLPYTEQWGDIDRILYNNLLGPLWMGVLPASTLTVEVSKLINQILVTK